jgi:hypothetical protein
MGHIKSSHFSLREYNEYVEVGMQMKLGGLDVRYRKPDLLLVLTLVLGLGVLITSYGGELLERMGIHAAPVILANALK